MSGSAPSRPDSISRYRLIDFSRSIAALAVLVLHYDRFIIQADWGSALPSESYLPPLRKLMSHVDTYGDLAVPFFWMISGFIFSFVYQGRKASFWSFSVRRFARLYPLHFATLLIVAVLQLVLFLQISTTLFIPNNDAYHFFLNVLFVSAWGFENGLSFNGPIWSVSVEIVIYICFWLFISLVPLRLFGSLTLALGCALLSRYGVLPFFSLCGVMFFCGAAVFFASQYVTTRGFLWGSVGSAVISALLLAFVPKLAGSATLSLILTFAPLIAVLAALDQVLTDRFRAIDVAAKFGDLSFSIYLLHFPLILALVNGWIFLGLPRSFFSENVGALALFILVNLGLSYLSLTRFEHPLRLYFQARLGRSRTAMPDRAVAPAVRAGAEGAGGQGVISVGSRSDQS